jgi:uncharacterized protein
MASSTPRKAARRCEVLWAGVRLQLLPERALWWPAERTLFVADIHLGKAASFRALGQPVPAGTTDGNLHRLDGLIGELAATAIVFLGDFLHARQGRTPHLMDALDTFRSRRCDVRMTLVRGNHDSRAGDPPASLGIPVVDEPWLLGPFACCHHPQSHPTHFVLAGHVHPVLQLQGKGRDSIRLPCFVAEIGQAVLPAFGEFTGGWMIEASPGRSFYTVGGDAVWAIPRHP